MIGDIVLFRMHVIKQNIFFDYLYVDDFVETVKWFIENDPKHQTYNVCSGKSYDYVSLAHKIADISNENIEIILENSDMRKEYSGDNALLQDEMKHNFRDMDNSIRNLYNWYKTNKSIIKEELLLY